jgi:deoxycytidine triphosphate deaminase
MGSLLRDVDIEDLLRATPPLIENFDVARLQTVRSPIKGSTLDLTIGDIFVPGVAFDALGSIARPRNEILLGVGQTAVLRSAEKIRMPRDLAGVGFPPSTKVSLAGVLSTNPGHVDPDYCGHLHLTVVNMGSSPFQLTRGERLLRLMLFKLEGDVCHPIGELPSPLSEELLSSRLSHDFLDVDGRAIKAAKSEELRLRSFQVWATIAAALITGLIALGYQQYQLISSQKGVEAQIAKIEGRLSTLGGSLNVVAFDEQVKRLGDFDARLKTLESRIPATAPPRNP